MNDRICLWVAALASLLAFGCESSNRPTVPVMPDLRLAPAVLTSEPDAGPSKVVEVKVPVPSPQLRPLSGGAAGKPAGPGTSPTQVVADAKRAATTQPTPDGFLNAIQNYDFAPGMVYTALTSPGFVTTVALRPGETLITAAAGDTTRWVVESVMSGTGAGQQTLILVKPRKPFLQTNLVVTTDQRVYQLDLTSTDQPAYHTMIAWNYPFGDVVAIRNQVVEAAARREAAVADGLDLAKANFNYVILKQKGRPLPPWAPLRAFDDGRKTYVQFPPKAAVTEMPPLFVLGRNDDAQLVNYRVRGDYYVVDRLFDRAELRLGEKPQVIVGIRRGEPR